MKIHRSRHLFVMLFWLLAACMYPHMVLADRLKDLTSIAGVRPNQLVGYGLVVGLPGTGDGSSALTLQSMRSLISQFGVTPNSALDLNGKNTAAVIVTARAACLCVPGQRVDVTVSTVGQSKSLRGGTLLMTPLLGADGGPTLLRKAIWLLAGLVLRAMTAASLLSISPLLAEFPVARLWKHWWKQTF